MNVSTAHSSTAHFINCTPVWRSHIHLSGLHCLYQKKCLCLTCNFSSLPLHLPLCCSMLRRHLQTSLIPSVTKTTRQRVIKIAPAALRLMSLSAHRSFGATSQQHAASIWPKSSFTNRVTLQTTEPKSHLCSFIQKLYC